MNGHLMVLIQPQKRIIVDVGLSSSSLEVLLPILKLTCTLQWLIHMVLKQILRNAKQAGVVF
jgi:hypothetical protein